MGAAYGGTPLVELEVIISDAREKSLRAGPHQHWLGPDTVLGRAAASSGEGKPKVQRRRRPVLSTLTTSPNAYSALGAADPVSHPTHARLDFRHVLPSRRRRPAQGRPLHGAPGSPGRIRARPGHAADAPLVPRNPNAASPGPPQSRSAQWRTQPPAIALSSSPLRTWALGPRARGSLLAIHAAQEPEGRRRAPSSRLEERRHAALLQCLA